MQCPNCHHEHVEGNFCVKCGTPLTSANEQAATVDTENAQTNPVPPFTEKVQPNVQLEKAKEISKMYFGFFMTVLKSPFSQASKVSSAHFVNGLISIVLFSLLIPLITYLNLGDLRHYIDSPFANVVLKPMVGFAIYMLLIAVYSFVGLKAGKVSANIKEVISRFGALLIPFIALFLVAIILSILQIKILAFLLLFVGISLSVSMVPLFIILSYKKESEKGLDAFYCSIIVYLLTGLTLLIMGNMLFSALLDAIESYLGSFFLF